MKKVLNFIPTEFVNFTAMLQQKRFFRNHLIHFSLWMQVTSFMYAKHFPTMY